MIQGIDSFRVGDNVTLTIRLKNDNRTQNAYNRFKGYLREYSPFGFKKSKGYGGRGLILGEKFIVNSIKTDTYWHLIITMTPDVRESMIEALQFFDFPKNHEIKDM